MSLTALAWGAVIAFVLGFAVWAAIAALGAAAAWIGVAKLRVWRSGRL
jgi:hypothetical protein